MCAAFALSLSKGAEDNTTSKQGAPSNRDGSRMSGVANVSDLGQTCLDERSTRTVNAANRNPVVERIMPPANPINFATNANAGEVGDSMEERPLFPATVRRFRFGSVG